MTDAGKRLLDRIYTKVGHADEAVAAIEAEAVAAEKARIRAGVEGLVVGKVYGANIEGDMFVDADEYDYVIERAAVLAIIEGGDDD